MIWTSELFALVALTFLLAGTVKGIIGMALPTVSLGILAATLDLKEAIVLMLVPSFVTNVWQAIIGGHFVSLLRRFWSLLATMGVGIWFATEALKIQDTSVLKGVLGVTLIIYGTFNLVKPVMPPVHRYENRLSPLIGLATGALAGLSGSTVLPVVPYLQALKLARDEFVQAMGICFSVAALSLGLALQSKQLLPVSLGFLSTIGVLPALVGMIIGQSIRKRLSEYRFKQVFFISVIILGGYIVTHTYIF